MSNVCRNEINKNKQCQIIIVKLDTACFYLCSLETDYQCVIFSILCNSI